MLVKSAHLAYYHNYWKCWLITERQRWSKFFESYLESSISLSLVGRLDRGVMRAEELERLWYRCHCPGRTRDLSLKLVEGMDALRLVSVRQALHKQLQLVFHLLIFFVLSWNSKRWVKMIELQQYKLTSSSSTFFSSSFLFSSPFLPGAAPWLAAAAAAPPLFYLSDIGFYGMIVIHTLSI